MTDIQKMIEEYRQELKESLLNYTDLEIHIAVDGFKKCLSKWQEAERWRKCGEHRPAVDEHLMYSYTCLVKLESGAYAIAVYHSCGAWMESGTEEYLDTVIEWKPIS